MAEKPDAVTIAANRVIAPTENRKKETAVETAERLMGAGENELIWCHNQPGFYFCTRDVHDTMNYAKGHDLEGKSRYRWEQHPSEEGVKLGWLLES